MNYDGKIIGVIIDDGTMIPCYPSSPIKIKKEEGKEDEEDNYIWMDYIWMDYYTGNDYLW